MDLDQYQIQSSKTAIYPAERAVEYLVLGMCSEAGEVAGKLKKIIRDNNQIIDDAKRLELSKEIGDVLWYISQLALELNITLSSVAKQNIEKLQERSKNNSISGDGDNR